MTLLTVHIQRTQALANAQPAFVVQLAEQAITESVMTQRGTP
jgi:hypothetical protein